MQTTSRAHAVLTTLSLLIAPAAYGDDGEQVQAGVKAIVEGTLADAPAGALGSVVDGHRIVAFDGPAVNEHGETVTRPCDYFRPATVVALGDDVAKRAALMVVCRRPQRAFDELDTPLRIAALTTVYAAAVAATVAGRGHTPVFPGFGRDVDYEQAEVGLVRLAFPDAVPPTVAEVPLEEVDDGLCAPPEKCAVLPGVAHAHRVAGGEAEPAPGGDQTLGGVASSPLVPTEVRFGAAAGQALVDAKSPTAPRPRPPSAGTVAPVSDEGWPAAATGALWGGLIGLAVGGAIGFGAGAFFALGANAWSKTGVDGWVTLGLFAGPAIVTPLVAGGAGAGVGALVAGVVDLFLSDVDGLRRERARTPSRATRPGSRGPP